IGSSSRFSRPSRSGRGRGSVSRCLTQSSASTAAASKSRAKWVAEPALRYFFRCGSLPTLRSKPSRLTVPRLDSLTLGQHFQCCFSRKRQHCGRQCSRRPLRRYDERRVNGEPGPYDGTCDELARPRVSAQRIERQDRVTEALVN